MPGVYDLMITRAAICIADVLNEMTPAHRGTLLPILRGLLNPDRGENEASRRVLKEALFLLIEEQPQGGSGDDEHTTEY